MAESQASTCLDERLFDDPSQLSQLLRQRAGSDKQLHFTTSSSESRQTIAAASPLTFAIPPQPHRAAAQLPTAPPLFDHAPSQRRVAAARHVKPRLPTHHSAPTSTEPVKEKEGAHKMHRSFAGMDAPGDTQPDSQIYREWTSGIFGDSAVMQSMAIPDPKSLFSEHVEDDDGDSPTDGIELVESSQDNHSPGVTSPTVIHDDDILGALPMGQYAATSPLKFETPAIAGRKRDNSGHTLSSAVRTNTTPSTVASVAAFPGFGFGAIAPMSLTQLYQNTQAPTSPAQADGAEDAAFTRPSPNFTHVRHSSPVPALSSPIKALCNETPRNDPVMRSSSEPRAEYVSMKESQERRRRTTREQHVRLVQEDSWEMPSAAQLRAQKKKNREELERKAAMSFAHITAPAPLSPGSIKKRTANAKFTPPRESRTTRPVTPPGENCAEVYDDEDSPDELSQNVPSTARTVVKHNSRDNNVLVPKTSSHPTRPQSAPSPRHSSQGPTPSSQLQRESHFQAPMSQPPARTLAPQSSRESVAVMDSQPDATADYDSVPRPKSLRFPSSPSTNQYSINQTTMATKTGYTSQVLSSSMPPGPPPKSSPDEVEEDVTPEAGERVPSSPPIMGPDDDLTYDEHERTYDEYAEDGAIRDSTEPQVVGEDDAMVDDEDLPLTKPDPDDEDDSEARDVDMEDEQLDLVQPQKVEPFTDQEAPESLEQERTNEDLSEQEDQVQSPLPTAKAKPDAKASPRPPRVQRQDTVPETDALEETQPSFFPVSEHEHKTGVHDQLAQGSEALDQTNSTEPFQTAREEPSGSQGQIPPSSPIEGGSDAIRTGERLRSLQDIHNLPETQQSNVEEEIEMPRLSGLNENDENDVMSDSSPAPPSAKRRKVTYTAKRNIFRSPLKPAPAEVKPTRQPSPTAPEVQQAPTSSPPTASAQDRETRGALAAVHARADAQAPYSRRAALKQKEVPRPSRMQGRKKGTLKAVSKELLMSLSSPVNSPSKQKSTSNGRSSTPVTPTKSRGSWAPADSDTAMIDTNEERDELADTTPEVEQVKPQVRSVSDHGEAPSGEFLVPNRVLASWPGSHFYPATCIGRGSGRQLQIRFDDGNITSLEASQVRALDLRPGDHVKVDAAGMKRHTYVVVGFKDKSVIAVMNEEFPITDRYGYTTIVLEEKPRDSLPAGKTIPATTPIAVPIGSVYLTTQLWTRLRDRSFNYSTLPSPSKSTSRIGTPIPAVDGTATPSFTRRGVTAPSLLRDVTGRAASVASTSTRSGSGAFSNMAFVLTSTAADVDKEAMAKIIRSNGGHILEQGFHELFESESGDTPSSSQSRRRSASVAQAGAELSLKQQYKDLGFVALISDSHSRSTKYIQALALNVPCLHLRWIEDSLNAARAVPFARYLLPAGVSKFLDPNGVVRSRTMTVYDPAADDLSFAQIVSNRDLLLHKQSVLLVTGKSKKEIEKRQPFIFLTHALGAANVGRCADLTAAADMLQDSQWDWIYVDNGEQNVADAAAELFGTGKPVTSGKSKKSKKRKRDETEEKEELVARGEVNGKRVRITCSEFVIQSLILGALVEE
ncbi:hypothetical protein FB567DRAFT_501843 [Paraphoma chrysanthemicola]|uniref:BRCT domain-containing protein n=1 Tax=Paraphoma chrysanthemicola TaxID=798071 RepID=A0A8K0QYC2_9PLEO|nr:hypothetical protein FB567DRAFT_501843 [Paraphoma chrysanthemicola]